MKTLKTPCARFLRAVAVLLAIVAPYVTHAANVFWTGPVITNTHPANSTQVDMLTTNHVGTDSTNNVWLTRGTIHPLYNAAAESAWNGSTSPLHTGWVVATGALTNAASLTYQSFDIIVGQPGDSPGLSVGKTFFVKIVPDNVYLSLKLTAWGNNNGGSFTYVRSTPAAAAPSVTVTITSPVSGATFTAPASLNLGASASATIGTVTNVQFFTNGTSLGSVTAAPFTLTSAPLAAGPYSLTAVATAGGISATSAAVSVTVLNPAAVTISGASVSGGQFAFSYNASVGLSFFVQRSGDLVNWTSLTTNVGSGGQAQFSDPFNPTGTVFYRVGQLPSP